MRKILKAILAIVLCITLSGCVYYKTTALFVKGDNVKVPIGSINPIAGKGVKGTVVRQVYWTNEKGRKIPQLSDIKVGDDEIDKTSGGLEIKK